MKNLLLFFCLGLIFSSCQALRDSPKYKFNDGVYKTRDNGRKEWAYIENKDDSIFVYRLAKGFRRAAVPVKRPKPKVYPGTSSEKVIEASRYWKQSLDVDVLTMPFKFRPARSSFPRQLSNHLNGALYLGYRNDVYELAYKQNPIGQVSQQITHLGFSVGLATGVGVTPMNPWVTKDSISVEYDGFIWTKAVSIIFAVDKLNFGLALGVDHLFDSNRKYWIYQGKPYLGLTVGLNLN
ncbi:hypothetical protein LZD49_03615 [Dyadobacter sp. CY261]|uniref:hypothetical protein n=1 Tax=Dyadobacter sp. CY261 TaxID=2907203 RepID=UPI001F1ACDDF|nr:hypothetical protein [Dyadobacter sp. CY261]MCF0069544.1 hypothetical protein [Dyadobacter sp. CY261]